MVSNPKPDSLSTRTLQRLNLALSAGRLLAWEYTSTSNRLEICGPGVPGHAAPPSTCNVDLESAMARVHGDDRQRVREALTATRQPGSVEVVEYRIRTRTGSLRWVRNHVMTPANAARQAADKSGISQDITRSVRAGHRASSFATLLEEHEQTLAHAPLGILTLEARGKIQTVNHAGLAMTGFAESRVLGKHGLRFVHTDDRAAIGEAFVKLISGALKSAIVPHRLQLCAGGYVNVQTHFAVVHDGRGRPMKVIAMLSDMTDQLAREKEIDEHREKLAHVSRLGTMGQMAAGLAHEINQPLSAIATYAQACRRLLASNDTDTEQFRLALDQVAEQAHRAGDVIRRMRSLARGTASTRVACRMQELIPEMMPLVNAEARHANVKIELDISDNLPPFVGDPVQIQQILLNLIRNGVDAMRGMDDRERLLSVKADVAHDGSLRVCVLDSGTGVGDEAHKHLFDPFFTTKESGMGMGLSISQSIAKAHGGKIGFKCNTGGGSVFWFTLPIDNSRQTQ